MHAYNTYVCTYVYITIFTLQFFTSKNIKTFCNNYGCNKSLCEDYTYTCSAESIIVFLCLSYFSIYNF